MNVRKKDTKQLLLNKITISHLDYTHMKSVWAGAEQDQSVIDERKKSQYDQCSGNTGEVCNSVNQCPPPIAK